MKPISIKFQSFGPYSEKQTINFENLKTSQMFIVSGPTGSGKTTIFDAICFALFGSASGDERKAEMLVSEFGSKDLETYVEFSFKVSNQMYTIHRSPKQLRPKKRGDGYTTIEPKVSLYEDDQVLTKQKEVADKIFNLLGMNEKQFRQIVLLPQGQFSKLLLSDSKSKEEIFRKIFDTHIFYQVANKMQKDKAELEKEYEKYSIQKETILNRFGKNTQLDHLRNSSQNLYTNIELVQDHLTKSRNLHQQLIAENERISQREKLKLDLQQAKQIQVDKNNKLQSYTPLIPYFSQISKLKDVEQLQQRLTSENKKLQVANEKLKLADDNNQQSKELLKVKTGQLQALYPTPELAINATQLINQLEQSLIEFDKYQSAINNLNKLQTDVKQLELEIANYDQVIKDNQNIDSHLEAAKTNLQDILAIQQQILGIQTSVEELEKFQLDYQSNAKNLETDNLSLQVEITKLNEFRNKLVNSTISNLANELKDSFPCPVCGSLEHPNPANIEQEIVSLEQINHLEEGIAKLQAKVNTQLVTVNGIKQVIDDKQTVINQGLDKLNITGTDNLNNYLNKISADLTTAELNINKLVQTQEHINQTIIPNRLNKVREQAELKGSINSITDALDMKYQDFNDDHVEVQLAKLKVDINSYNQLKEECVLIANKIEVYNSEITHLKDYLEQMNLDVSELTKTKRTLLNELNGLNIDINTYTIEYLEQNKHIYDLLNNELSDINTKIKYLNQQIESIKIVSNDQIKQQLEEIKTTLDNFELIVQLLKSLYDEVSKALVDLEHITKQSQSVDKQYAVIGKLSDLANGKTTNKISFERYVLAMYFKQIIVQANIYLHKMTNNRYDLVYRANGTGNAGRGLDLDVFDLYTGTNRDIKTLSGGETFKAALALSLGLSDVLQLNKGGIHIEAMFIDEGFGTLDSESLGNAVETLIDLESSGRMIGIISHVEELKNQVANQVVINKTINGSALTVNFH